jgi:predicted amidohydrolase
MQIAVIQHELRNDDHEDAVALAEAALDAADFGAQIVVFPRVPVLANLDEGDPVPRIFEAIDATPADAVAFLNPSVMPQGLHLAELPHLGLTALFVGDACMDAGELLSAAERKPNVAILAPGAENDMQAEAVAELAIGLSSSLAGLVIVAEAAGAEPGDPGHGGSLVVQLGEVIAEAMGGDENLNAEIEVPVAQPEPREQLPQVPSILSARIAHHQGHKPDVDYPADLS